MKNSLDLHGVRHANVQREVDKFMGEHLMAGSRSVVIITGNSEKMKALVGETLADYGLNYVENTFNSGEVSVDLT